MILKSPLKTVARTLISLILIGSIENGLLSRITKLAFLPLAIDPI